MAEINVTKAESVPYIVDGILTFTQNEFNTFCAYIREALPKETAEKVIASSLEARKEKHKE